MKPRGRDFRRAKRMSKIKRRLSEDRNQHYRDLRCPCWTDAKRIAFFAEQPKHCSCWMCSNPRRVFKSYDRFSTQEKRAFQESMYE